MSEYQTAHERMLAERAQALKDREEAAKRKKDGGSEGRWIKWEVGDSKTIRLLPDPDPTQASYRKYGLHYGINGSKTPHVCLGKTTNNKHYEDCPFCKYLMDLRKLRDPSLKEFLYEVGRKDRAVYRGVERLSDPEADTVPKLVALSSTWSGKGLHDRILTQYLGNGPMFPGKDLSHPFTGYDLLIARPDQTSYQLDVAGISSPIFQDRGRVEALLLESNKIDIEEPAKIPDNQYQIFEEIVAKYRSGEYSTTASKGRGGKSSDEDGPAGVTNRTPYKPSRRPDCFADPNTYDTENAVCKNCDHLAKCAQAIDVLSSTSTDPVSEEPEWLKGTETEIKEVKAEEKVAKPKAEKAQPLLKPRQTTEDLKSRLQKKTDNKDSVES
jgi:hypothetical protein